MHVSHHCLVKLGDLHEQCCWSLRQVSNSQTTKKVPKRHVITSEHQFWGSLSTTIADTELFIPEDDPARKGLMHTTGMMRGIPTLSYQPAIIRISECRPRAKVQGPFRQFVVSRGLFCLFLIWLGFRLMQQKWKIPTAPANRLSHHIAMSHKFIRKDLLCFTSPCHA